MAKYHPSVIFRRHLYNLKGCIRPLDQKVEYNVTNRGFPVALLAPKGSPAKYISAFDINSARAVHNLMPNKCVKLTMEQLGPDCSPFSSRAYPSLNLTLHVSKDQQSVQCVLPGLRFDDIDHTGQPNMATVFDIMSHVETAAVGLEHSFVDYVALRRQDFRHYIKACVMEISSSFYEMTTPKAPLDIRIRLSSTGTTSFTTFSELSCGGKMSPSITLENVHCLVHKPTASIHELPEWWKDRFSANLKNPTRKLEVTPAIKPENSFPTSVLIPLSDTDHNERTRCASYLRYFMDNTSVASRRAFYEHIKSTFHEFHIKRLSMYYYRASFWGDTLKAETWQTDDPLDIHCLISNNSSPIWYGKMELHERVFGLPSLKTDGNNKGK